MKTSPSQKIKIGVFTIVGILLLVAAIFIIGKRQNLFGDTYNIYGTFKNVGGLQVGNNIRFAGINVGTVQGIEIVNDTTVRVDMIMQKRVQPFVKTDAMAAIGSDGLMGDKLITIAPGSPGNPQLADGGKINSVNPVDYDKIIARVMKITENAEMITSSLSGIVGQVSHGKGSIGRLLYSDTLARNLEGTVRTATSTLSSIKQTSDGVNENMKAVKHNFLLRGYFKKKDKEKAKKEQEQKDKANAATGTDKTSNDKDAPKTDKK